MYLKHDLKIHMKNFEDKSSSDGWLPPKLYNGSEYFIMATNIIVLEKYVMYIGL